VQLTAESNNLAERELGVIGRGRKNYLFAGSDIGGRRLATLYTVVRTCQRMEIDAFAYLAWVLPRLSDLPVNRVPGVLPTLLPGGGCSRRPPPAVGVNRTPPGDREPRPPKSAIFLRLISG